jgi:non-ribosomal peptide synthetase component E (peptide arylation enzyme)
VTAVDHSSWGLQPIEGELAQRWLREGAWDDRSLGQFLAESLLADPSRRIRIFSPTHPYIGTVGEVYALARRVAGGLRALGVQQGDVV